jgi:hypothetical protein
MTVKFVSHMARLFGFVVSPLLTAPAAAGDLAHGVALAPSATAALHVVDPATASDAGHGLRRVRL